MATYFPSTNNQTDTAPMLYSRDHYSASSESHVLTTNTTMYMNFSSSSGSYSDALAVNSQRQANYMDIEPLVHSDSNTSQVLLNFGDSRSIEPDFRNDTLLMNPGAYGVPQCVPSQGLSLSLGTHVPSSMQISSLQYQNTHSNFSFEDEGNFQAKQSRDNDYMLSSVQLSNVDDRKGDMLQFGIPKSRYLKAAQELLEEVVNVKKAFEKQNIKKESMKGDGTLDSSGPTESSTNELPVAEKQELQNKMAKLLSMLEEVDRRYRQYYHQMQTIVSSFDSIAGPGSAKLYTALALQTISRHFRCLRDAINNQIQLARKSLGEEDSSLNDKGLGGISRLRYVDQQLKQQRALQQLGMMQQHAWRPQRGLPESSVSILRAWLFEHFLNPYPKDSDKIMLARQTGLTRSQVSNWFINARVRLWKPMVEEMYKEEGGDRENDSNSSSETTPKPVKITDTKAPYDQGDDNQHASTSTGPHFILNPDQTTSLEMMGSDANPSFQNLLSSDPQSDRFMYHMSELERFGNGGGVSLTLGLQQGEGGGTLGMGDSTEHGFSLRDFYSSMKD